MAKPCPVCGSAAPPCVEEDGEGAFRARCSQCGWSAPATWEKGTAEAAWENRPTRSWLMTWWRSGDTGRSSETIACILSGRQAVAEETARELTAPWDTSDVGRCIRLLDLAAAHGEDWRGRLAEVATAVPRWRPLVPRWAEIEAAYHADVVTQTAARKAAEKRWPATWHRRAWCPDSECWRLVSMLSGNGDPYRRRT